MQEEVGYTSEMCQQAMMEELESLFKDKLFTGQEGMKHLNIYKQFLPIQTTDEDEADKNNSPFPCIIVKETSGEIDDEHSPQLVLIQLVICGYDRELDRQGYVDTVNIKEAIMQHFKRKPVFGGAFKVSYPRKWDLSDDDADYYYWGIVNFICETPNNIRNEEVEALI